MSIRNIKSFQNIGYYKIGFIQTCISEEKKMRFVRKADNSKDEYDNIKLDESKLSISEKERLAFIQKLSLEADQMIKDGGIRVDFGGDDLDKAVTDTQWTGQSDLEITKRSRSNYDDLLSRPLLAVGDVISLLIFASIGNT